MKKGFLFLLLLSFNLLYAQVETPFINITGTAELVVPAEIIAFHVNVRTINTSMKECKKLNDKAVENLIFILKENGISNEDTEIAPLTLGKNYEFTEGRRKQTGFFASVNVAFKLRKFENYLILTEKLAGNPDFEVNNSSFELSKEKIQELNQTVYKDALLAAKRKAENMTSVMNMQLGMVKEIEESGDAYQTTPSPFNYSTKLSSDMGGGQADMVSGKITIRKTVRVKFDIKALGQ